MAVNFKRNKKERYQQIIFSLFLGVLLILVVGFLIVSSWRINQKRAELSTRLETLQKELQTLQERKKELEAQVSQTSNQDYLEKEAREQLNLKKPGEEVVTVLPQKEETPKSEGKSFWDKFLEKLKF